ncbi:tetratricopeptide repeat protein [Geminisphaera colitermitum]|uniref:tetratricopeptide repeat protein n=1 Tax=Geminisphaera colitermitum TaxID=1148786 RepID=UPI000158C798|nr:tetratricopeptide repeat protein [Geminisphaera colitermitum]
MSSEPAKPQDFKKASSSQASTRSNTWLPFRLTRSGGALHLRIMWKNLLITLGVLLVLGWLSLAGAAYLFIKYKRDFADIRYTQVLFLFVPSVYADYQVARGNYMIEQAKKLISEGDYGAAIGNLRVGVSKAPANREGRLLLAQFQLLTRRPDNAQATLLAGINPNHVTDADTDYLKTVFTFLFQQQQDDAVIALTDQLLKGNKDATPTNRLIALAKATAAYYRGNYDLAEDVLETYNLNHMRDGVLLNARIAWERGQRELALATLRELSQQAPTDEEIYGQLVTYLRDAGLESELRQTSILRQLAYPDRPRPRIDLLYVYDKEKNNAQVQSTIDEIFRDFPKNSETLLALADFAANTGRPDLARRVFDHCKANNLNWEGAALMTVEAYVVAKDYRRALDTAQQLLTEHPDWGTPTRYASVFNGLRAIANYGLGDAVPAHGFLKNFLEQSNVRAENLVAVSNRLQSVGAKTEARDVLAHATKSDPLNQPALSSLIKLDIELGQTSDLAANMRKLLTMRKPSQALLRSAFDTLGSDRFLFAPDQAIVLDEIARYLTRNRDSLDGNSSS